MEPTHNKKYRTIRTLSLVFLCSLIAGGLGTLLGKTLNKSVLADATETPTVVIADRDLDFGEEWEQSALVLKPTIENRGTETVTLAHFSTSCDCTAIEPKTLSIPPGQSRTISLTIDLTKKASAVKPEENGVREVAIWVSAVVEEKGSLRKANWTFKGVARQLFRFDPPLLDTGVHSEFSPFAAPRKVLCWTTEPLADLGVEPPSRDWLVAPKKVDDRKWEITFTPASQFPIGKYQQSMEVKGRLIDGTTLPGHRYDVWHEVVSDIETTPASVVFSAVKQNQTVSETITIRSLTGRSFSVEKITAESDSVSVAAMNPNVSYTIRQQIAALGGKSSRVFLTIRTDKDVKDYPIVVSYHGVE